MTGTVCPIFLPCGTITLFINCVLIQCRDNEHVDPNVGLGPKQLKFGTRDIKILSNPELSIIILEP
jgi:hypothetical protein